jgi:hypothetical protein
MLGREEELVSEFTRKAGPRQPHGRPADTHLLGQEVEVLEALDVGIGDRSDQLA